MNPRFPIGTRVIVDLYRFDTPQQGIVVQPQMHTWVAPEPKDLVCIRFDSPLVSERYNCNRTDAGNRGYLVFSNDHEHSRFNLGMIHPSVLKASLEATNET